MRYALRFPTLALVAWLAASLAFAGPKDDEAIAPDPSRPAIGEWTGIVSWNTPLVSYVWSIYSGGAFSSGRLGRGPGGGGAWNENGTHVTLKYSDGFRYEGELRENSYVGTAFRANGDTFGGFSMHRAMKTADVLD